MSAPHQNLRRPTVRIHWPATLAALMLVLALRLTYPSADPEDRGRRSFGLEVGLACDASGQAQVFYDRGNGFNEHDSSTQSIVAGDRPILLSFPLRQGAIRRLRLDPINGADAQARITTLRIVEIDTGRTVREIQGADLAPNEQIASVRAGEEGLLVTPRPGAIDPFLSVRFEPALRLGPSPWTRLARALPGACLIFGAAWVFGYGLSGRADTRLRTCLPPVLRNAPRSHPRWCLTAIAAVSVTLCCHPMIFAGRSLVSPGYGLALLHPEHPTTQLGSADDTEDARGSDIGSMLWQHLPYSVVQHRALVEEGTFPLWNRYNSCGADLLGQGQSMLGDPFHLPVILAGGAAWAWDAKFLLARFLFALGVGFAAFAAIRRLGPAALVAVAAPFIGFFTYRINHPAVITVCYSPWVLVAWLEVARAHSTREAVRWLALLFVANGCLLLSGTVKEAVMVFLMLNLAGVGTWILSAGDGESRRRILILLGGLAVAGILASAPWWMALASALSSSWTTSDSPFALRIPLARFAGFFDGMFYSAYFENRSVYGPCLNFVALLGILGLAARIRAVWRDPVVVACGAAAFLALSLAFDVPWLPTRWILAVPILGNIGHVSNTFSCAALPLVLVLAAAGFAAVTEGTRRPCHPAVWIIAASLAGVLITALLWDLAPHRFESPAYRSVFHVIREHAFFFQSILVMLLGWVGLAVAERWMRRGAGASAAGVVLLAAALVPMLGRHGQVLGVGQPDYFFSPAPRADLAVRSPAMEWIESRSSEPSRVVGIDAHLFAGFTAVYGLEGPNGPDAIVNRFYREWVDAAGLSRPADWCFPTDAAALEPRRRVLDMLNVRYYVSCNQAPPPSWLRQVSDLDLAVFESPDAWPRAFFVDGIVPYDHPAELVRKIETGDGRPLAAMLRSEVMDSGVKAGESSTRRVVAGTDYRLRTNETAFTIEAPSAGVAVLHEAWLPDKFRATVDGQPAEVLRVNHAFKGVRIDHPGTHRIRFEFHPPWLNRSLALGGFGLLLATAILAFAGWRGSGSAPTKASGRNQTGLN